MNKLLTIIVPTYNMEQYLNECLDSLLIESNLDLLEVIVVNDGSKDRSSEIAHTYETRFPETFRVIDKENGNYGSCINRALKECKGKYIKVLDADDYYDTKEFEKFVDHLKNVNADMVFTPYTRMTFENELIKKITIPDYLCNNVYYVNDFDINHELQNIKYMHALCVKTSVLTDNGYYQTEGISYTDLELVFYSLLYANTMTFVDFNIYQWRLGREGQTMTEANRIKNVLHYGYIANKFLSEIVELPDDTPKCLLDNLIRCTKYDLKTFLNATYTNLQLDEERKQVLNEMLSTLRQMPYFKNIINTDSWRFKLKYKLCIEHNFSSKLFLAAQKIINMFIQ